MISYISGIITQIYDTKVIILQAGIGFEISCPTAHQLSINTTAQLHTYLHWSQENGPSLYGFTQPLQKDLFLMIIECQGIGPKLGISILEQTDSANLISIIAKEDVSALSKLKGLGAKKAEILCMHLKNKVQKLLHQYPDLSNNTNLGVWNDVHETLISLNYSAQEIRQATSIVKESLSGQILPFDLLLRKALIVLAKK